MNKAVFLDRDGTINFEVSYLHEPEKFQFIPKTPEALKMFQDYGFKIIIVTNQAGIAKGIYELKDMELTNNFMVEQLAFYGVTIDAIYYCPHRAEDQCDCRKPAPGMTLKAIADFEIDPTISWTIGDKLSDTEAGFLRILRLYWYLRGMGKRNMQN